MMIVAGVIAVFALPGVWWLVDAMTPGRSSRWRTAASVLTVALVLGLFPIGGVVATLVAMPLAMLGVVLAHIDIATRRLPDVLVLSAFPPIGAGLIVVAIVTGRPDSLLRSGAAAAVCLAGYGVAAVCGGLGFGDVKLAGLLGLMLGWVSWTVVVAACVLAFVFAGVPALSSLSRHGRRGCIPFGPPLLAGALAAVALS